MAKHGSIQQDFLEDVSLLLTVGKLYEFVRDPHNSEPSQFFHHTVRLNAIRSQGQWYEIQKLPSGHFHYSHITDMLNHVQMLTLTEKIGFGFEEVAFDETAEDGDGLIFNPDEWKIKISNADFEFPYVCTHKREYRLGDKCPGQIAECNDRGHCVFGTCNCNYGYGQDNCIESG